jgi:uncharacterized protein (DUF2147 family)
MLHCPRSIARAIVCSGFVFATGQALAADPTGDWRVSDGVANMWGAVSWEKIPGGRDSNNPDASKQSRPTLGMPTLINMKKKPGVDQWEGQVYNAKDGQTYSATIKPVGTDQLEIQGCVLGFLCGGETWTRVGPPIPSSPVNSMAKGTKSSPGAPPKSAATAPAPQPAPPKTTGSVTPAPKAGQKQAAAQADIGDICLLPDLARFAH